MEAHGFVRQNCASRPERRKGLTREGRGVGKKMGTKVREQKSKDRGGTGRGGGMGKGG